MQFGGRRVRVRTLSCARENLAFRSGCKKPPEPGRYAPIARQLAVMTPTIAANHREPQAPSAHSRTTSAGPSPSRARIPRAQQRGARDRERQPERRPVLLGVEPARDAVGAVDRGQRVARDHRRAQARRDAPRAGPRPRPRPGDARPPPRRSRLHHRSTRCAPGSCTWDTRGPRSRTRRRGGPSRAPRTDAPRAAARRRPGSATARRRGASTRRPRRPRPRCAGRAAIAPRRR